MPFDKRLWREDIDASLAHIAMLGKQGIVSAQDAEAIASGLRSIAEEYAHNGLPDDDTLEDIHMATEALLVAKIGAVGGRLHTARSRNDQAVTDFKLWVRGAVLEAQESIKALQSALLARADEHKASIMPGFTHLQSAQPVTLGHHLLAYVEMLGRDTSRFADAHTRAALCPLGAAALAGTSFSLDRQHTAQALGFASPTRNSLDSVSDRDFALDYLMAASQCALHLSRLAEEIVIWASQPFSFVTLSDAWSTGSSIMPQKRNPDAAELVRSHAGRIIGQLNALMISMKGLPLAYSKDMQNDKIPVFEAHDLLQLSLAAMRGMVETLVFNTRQMHALANSGFATATDLADWLVRVADVPFRQAHHITGAIVKAAEECGVQLAELPLAAMQAIDARITQDVFSVLTVEASVASRTSYGGTAPVRVAEQIDYWRKTLA